MAEKRAATGGTSGATGGRRRLALALGASLIAGGAGYWLTSGGVIPSPRAALGLDAMHPPPPAWARWTPPPFVPLEPIVVSLGPSAEARYLRATLVLEVAPGAERMVQEASPRVRDALNIYLRAVDERDFSRPALMVRLRAQLLQQARMVLPEGAVADVLVQEFILN